jgi:hypothetical protein
VGGHRASGAGDDLVDGPVDLAAVRADDALLDALAGGAGRAEFGPGYGFGSPHADDEADDERIAAILAAWRADIEADPMPELVSLDEAMEAVTAGHEARDRVRGRARRRMPFAVAAAAAVVAVAGLTVAVHGSQPGDALFGVSKVFFSEHAAEVQRVDDVRQTIDRANQAIQRGDRETARRELASANLALPELPATDREPLQTRHDEIQSSLAPEPPASSSSSPSKSSSKSPDGKPTRPSRPGAEAGAADPRRDADPTKPGTQPSRPTDSSPTSPDTSSSGQPTEPKEATGSPGSSSSPTTTTTAPPSPAN